MSDSVDVEIRWSDVDAYGHVHHIALVAIAEHGRSRWLDSVMGGDDTWPYAIVRLAFDYRAQARFEDHFVRCQFRVARVGKSSVTLSETFSTRDGTVIAECEAVIVAWDQPNATTKPLEPGEVERLNARKEPAAAES